ncbi:MAG: hypothetical protein ACRDV8_01065, partial [Acidimicrobiales bacterium]
APSISITDILGLGKRGERVARQRDRTNPDGDGRARGEEEGASVLGWETSRPAKGGTADYSGDSRMRVPAPAEEQDSGLDDKDAAGPTMRRVSSGGDLRIPAAASGVRPALVF